jgi:orotate phosphoribosyltransferase
LPPQTENFIVPCDPLATLHNCGGYYEAPPGGPLVGYAGKYAGPNGEKLQFVGRIYANFAKADQHPWVLHSLARDLTSKIPKESNCTLLVAAPMGGIKLAEALGYQLNIRTIFAEKKVTALATEHGREQAQLEFKRYEVNPGDQVLIVEDVCNNFSTTWELIKLIEAAGGTVVGIVCFLNRSNQSSYCRPDSDVQIPVFALEARFIQEYRQDDPEVANDIANGNIAWKPKDEWSRLITAMEASS